MEPAWCVAHTRPRAEKKVAEFCEREGWIYQLPLYSSPKSYRGKRLVFRKPLFPGYVFVRLGLGDTTRLRQQQHVANLLIPPDQAEFTSQLDSILVALSDEREIRVAPEIVVGQKVRICTGPLRGVEGVVVQRSGMLELFLRLDFIGQGAAVRVAADEVEAL